MTVRVRSIARTCVVASILVAGGCKLGDALSAGPHFGDDFAIRSDIGSDAVWMDAEDLHASVSYTGGCRPHTFTVRYRRRADTSELWLTHDAEGDPCESYLSEVVSQRVPSAAWESANIVFLTPDGGSVRLR